MKIEIDIEGDGLYTKIVYLLDKENFLADIEELRGCWYISKLIPYDEFETWMETLHPEDFLLSKDAYKILHEDPDRLEIARNLGLQDGSGDLREQDLARLNPMDLEVELLIRKHNLRAFTKEFILKAVVCGRVTEKDLGEVKEKYAPDSLFEELYLNPPHEYKVKARSAIKRDREWYWLRKQGYTYSAIAKQAKERGKIDTQNYIDNVERAITRYKTFLGGTFR